MAGEETKPIFRPYQLGEDDEAVARLFNQVFSEKITPSFWRHKYAGNPAGGWAFLTFVGGELVSVSGWPVRFLRFHGEEIRVVSMCDVMVHPAWRGRYGGRLGSMARPLWEKIFKEAEIPFGVAFPNPKHYLVGKRFVRARDLGKFRVEVVSFSRLWRLPKVAEAFRLLSLLRYSPPEGFFLQETRGEERDLKALDLLWQRVRERFSLAFVKDARSLKWRYFDWERLIPLKGRHFFLLKEGQEIRAFLVLKEAWSGPIKGFELEEILSLPEEAKSAFQAACWLSLKKGGHFLRYLSSPALDLPRGLPEREAPALWRPFAYEGPIEDLEKRLKPSLWHLTLGDVAV